MHRWTMLAVLLVGACTGTDALDARMKPMVGASESSLVAAMGRAPDSSSEATQGTKVLQWRWQKAYAIPDRMLFYTYAGGMIRPIPHTAEGIVRDQCMAEWTVENGTATRYSRTGNDCAAAATELAAQ